MLHAHLQTAGTTARSSHTAGASLFWVPLQETSSSEPIRTLSSISDADADLTETGAALRNTDSVLPAASDTGLATGPVVPETGSDLLQRPGSSPLPVSKMLRMVRGSRFIMCTMTILACLEDIWLGMCQRCIALIPGGRLQQKSLQQPTTAYDLACACTDAHVYA